MSKILDNEGACLLGSFLAAYYLRKKKRRVPNMPLGHRCRLFCLPAWVHKCDILATNIPLYSAPVLPCSIDARGNPVLSMCRFFQQLTYIALLAVVTIYRLLQHDARGLHIQILYRMHYFRIIYAVIIALMCNATRAYTYRRTAHVLRASFLCLRRVALCAFSRLYVFYF